MKKIICAIRNCFKTYKPEPFWKSYYRASRQPQGGLEYFKTLWAFYKVRKIEHKFNSSVGLKFGSGAIYEGIPTLPHGLSGIFINPKAVIGRNCTIFQQVTIGEAHEKAPVIGDNVLIGAGAKIIGGIHVGDNVKIGANCIVVEDIPANSTVVMHKPRIIRIKDI